MSRIKEEVDAQVQSIFVDNLGTCRNNISHLSQDSGKHCLLNQKNDLCPKRHHGSSNAMKEI